MRFKKNAWGQNQPDLLGVIQGLVVTASFGAARLSAWHCAHVRLAQKTYTLQAHSSSASLVLRSPHVAALVTISRTQHSARSHRTAPPSPASATSTVLPEACATTRFVISTVSLIRSVLWGKRARTTFVWRPLGGVATILFSFVMRCAVTVQWSGRRAATTAIPLTAMAALFNVKWKSAIPAVVCLQFVWLGVATSSLPEPKAAMMATLKLAMVAPRLARWNPASCAWSALCMRSWMW